MTAPVPSTLESQTLAGIFFDNPGEQLGRVKSVAPSELSPMARTLLDHHQHMTVTVERHHGEPVRVEVLREAWPDGAYAREIVLRLASGRAVLYGIVRILLDAMPDPVRQLILARNEPLGRILIAHDVMRRVERVELLEIHPGKRLAELFGLRSLDHAAEQGAANLFGRTALIHVDGKPAIELLEIVA